MTTEVYTGLLRFIYFPSDIPQKQNQLGSIFDFWLLELVPYIVSLVLKFAKQGIGATRCADAKFVDGIENCLSHAVGRKRRVRRELGWERKGFFYMVLFGAGARSTVI